MEDIVKIRHLLKPLLLIMFLASHTAWGITFPLSDTESDSLNIIRKNKHEYLVELRVPTFEIKSDQDGSHRIDLPGWAKLSQKGGPELPVKGVLLEIPEAGTSEIRILENIRESVPNCQISPVPHISLSDDRTLIKEYWEDRAIYESSAFYPASQAEIGPRSYYRDTCVARLMIRPFQWNPASKELRHSKLMRIQVKFEARNPKPEIRKPKIEARNPEPETRLKLSVQQDGIYRISSDDLSNQGVEPNSIDPATFQMFNLGREVAINVISKDDTFSPGDAIEFFGKGVDNQYTRANVYWLAWGETSGKRMEQTDGTVTGCGEKQNTFYETLHFEENHFLWGEHSGVSEQDYAFWDKLTVQGNPPYSTIANYSINTYAPDSEQPEAIVRLAFRGRSTSSHHAIIRWNNTLIGEAYWSDTAAHVREMNISPEILNDGENLVSIELPGDTGAIIDVIYLNWLEITYPRRSEAVQDRLMFTAQGNNSRLEMEIGNLRQSDILIYDISDPENVRQVRNASAEPEGDAYKAVFEDHVSEESTYYVLTTEQTISPDSITARRSSDLKNTANRADYILITSEDLLSATRPLCEFRQRQGLRVKAVCTEDIFDEFNHGLYDPKAIRDFLKYAYENWKSPAPAYVLLVGDANKDYRDYLGTGKANKVPTHLSVTSAGLTPDDNWYACVQSEDLLPEMMIGRIPGPDPDTVTDMVEKIIAYESNQDYHPRSVLLIADNDPEYEQLNEDIIPYLPEGFSADKAFQRLYEDGTGSHWDMLASFDEGQLITHYVGHGSFSGVPGLFGSWLVAASANVNKLSFIISMSCLDGHFSQPDGYCLSEEFMSVPEKGAVGIFSSAGLTDTTDIELLDKEIFSALFGMPNHILGVAITHAKIAAYGNGLSDEVMMAFNLTGDPATKLRWQPDVRIPGDTDGNSLADLKDMILSLQVVSGIYHPTQPIYIGSDISGDGKIGMEEVIYTLQKCLVYESH